MKDQAKYKDAAEKVEAIYQKVRQDALEILKAAAQMDDVQDYAFKTWDGGEARLSELMQDRGELMVIHNMGRKCAYCTLWADGFNGVHGHLENRAPFVLISPDSPAVQKEFAESRGWGFRMVSSECTTFPEDMGFWSEKHGVMPGISTFKLAEDGSIKRVGMAPFGPGDPFCGVWHLLDLLDDGAKGWSPKYTY